MMIDTPITTNDQTLTSTSTVLKNKRPMASLMIQTHVARRRRVSNSADRFSILPCP
jgi:hypothetical protein